MSPRVPRLEHMFVHDGVCLQMALTGDRPRECCHPVLSSSAICPD